MAKINRNYFNRIITEFSIASLTGTELELKGFEITLNSPYSGELFEIEKK